MLLNFCKKILMLTLVAALPMATIQAQKKAPKKRTATAKKAAQKPAPKRTKPAAAAPRTPKPSAPKPSSRKPVDTGYKPQDRAETAVPSSRRLPTIPKKDDPINLTLVVKDSNAAPIDTTPSSPSEVIITSAFKPFLRNASKMIFTAATPVIDTSKIQLSYNIPSQNLVFTYQPATIKPLALALDSGYVWAHQQYIKVGYGNLASPYVEGGFSMGNGTQSMLAVHGKYVAAKGSLPAQQYSKANIDVLSIFTTKKKQEITTKLFWDYNTVYRYGYQPDSLKLSKDSLRQRFNDIGFSIGINNKVPALRSITYHPELQFDLFSNTSKIKETNLQLKVPISKAFGRIFEGDAAIGADISHYNSQSAPDTAKLNNNLFYASAALRFKTPNFKLRLGVQPTIDNDKFAVLPNLTIEARIKNINNLVLQGGWVGHYQKNNYKNLATFNPFIAPPTTMFNTRIIDIYGGIKGSIGKHITGSATIGYMKMTNAALFVNDTIAGKNQNFLILKEPTVGAVKLKAEVAYSIQEKLLILGGLTYLQYSKLDSAEKPFGLLPLEVNGALRWKMLPKLTLKSDVYFFEGTYYRDLKAKTASQQSAAFDVNIGAEYTLMKHLNAWAEVNNLLNNHYQRWNQYPALGIQLLAGVVYSFR